MKEIIVRKWPLWPLWSRKTEILTLEQGQRTDMTDRYLVGVCDAHNYSHITSLNVSWIYTFIDILCDVPTEGLVTNEEIEHGGKCGNQHHGETNPVRRREGGGGSRSNTLVLCMWAGLMYMQVLLCNEGLVNHVRNALARLKNNCNLRGQSCDMFYQAFLSLDFFWVCTLLSRPSTLHGGVANPDYCTHGNMIDGVKLTWGSSRRISCSHFVLLCLHTPHLLMHQLEFHSLQHYIELVLHDT